MKSWPFTPSTTTVIIIIWPCWSSMNVWTSWPCAVTISTQHSQKRTGHPSEPGSSRGFFLGFYLSKEFFLATVLLHLHCLLFRVLGCVSVQHFVISADVKRDLEKYLIDWNRKGSSPNCCFKVGSTYLSLYVVALRFPFTWTKGPSWNYEKQPQTIILPPPNFTVGTMHLGR
jgi:hypothetical protein